MTRVKTWAAYGLLVLLTLALISATDGLAVQVEVPEAAKVAAEKYSAEAARVSREHTAVVAELKQKHAAQLDQLIAKAKDAGDLDGVLKLREEKEKVARSESPLSVPAPTSAATARRTYAEALKKADDDFKKTARAKLDDFLKELSEVEKAETKADRIASAKAVRAYRLEREKSGTTKPVIRENPLPDATPGEWVDLLEWSEGVDWAQRGIDWNANVEGKPTKTGIALKPIQFNRFPLPAIIDGDYEMQVEFTRHGGNEAVAVFFPVGIHTVALELGGSGGSASHVRFTDGKGVVERRPAPIANGQPHRLFIRARHNDDKASFSIDWNDIKDYMKWDGSYSVLTNLDIAAHWQTTTIRRPWIGSWANNLTFSKVQVRMLSGTIRRDVIIDADREQDLKIGFVRLVGEKAIAPKVGWAQFVINQIPLEVGPGGTERLWPLITRDFKVCEDFYGAHAPSRLKCPIPTGAKSFSAIGYNDSSRTAKYIVLVDGKAVYDSGVTDIAIVKVEIPAKATLLELAIDPAGDQAFDHTYWCYPRFHSVAIDKLSDKMLDGKPGPLKFTIAPNPSVGAQTLTHNQPINTLKAIPLHFRDAQPCDEFLFAHAPSTVTYRVPEDMTRFTAIGYNALRHHVKYEVWADTKRIYESPQAGIIPIDVKLPSGTKTIELKINELSDGNSSYSMWCYPRLHRK